MNGSGHCFFNKIGAKAKATFHNSFVLKLRALSLMYVRVQWGVKLFRISTSNCFSPNSCSYENLKKTEFTLRKKVAQKCWKPAQLYMNPLLVKFDQIVFQNFPRKISSCNSALSFLVIFWMKLHQLEQFLRVSCGWKPFLNGKSYIEVKLLSPILKVGFQNVRSSLLYRMEKRSEILTFLDIKSIEQVIPEFRVVSCDEGEILWLLLYAWCCIYR